MANVSPIKGESGILYIYQDTSWKPIACLTSNSLSSTVSEIESITKCNPGKVIKSAGVFSYSLSAEGEYIDTTTAGGDTTKQSHDALFSLQQALALVEWKIDTDITNATSVKYYGSAIITDLEATFGSGDEFSTFSATFSGSGAVTTVDPHVSI
jgi:hypothetical protein